MVRIEDGRCEIEKADGTCYTLFRTVAIKTQQEENAPEEAYQHRKRYEQLSEHN